MGFMMKAAARAALGGGKSRAAKVAAEAARVAAAKARAAAAVALAQFCAVPENSNEPKCLVLQKMQAEAAATRERLMEHKMFCESNYWSFSCSNIWGWLFLLVLLVLICCCCCADDEDDRRRNRNRPVAFMNMRNEPF